MNIYQWVRLLRINCHNGIKAIGSDKKLITIISNNRETNYI